MDVENQSLTSDIFLRGLTDDTELQPLIFILFLCMYLITIFGNVLIMLAINCDSHLPPPCTFFYVICLLMTCI